MSSPRPRPTTGRAPHGVAPVPITVASGLDRLAVDDLVTGLALRTDRLATVYADPTPAGQGHITMRVHDSQGQARTWPVALDHRCVSCTVRTATLAALTQLAAAGDHDALVLQLHPGTDPGDALRQLHRDLPAAARLDSHVTVLPGDWLTTLAGGTALSDHAAALTGDDDRFAATVLCAGIETATTMVVPIDALPGAEERAVLDLLAPAAVRLRLRSVLDVPIRDLLHTGRFDPRRLDPLDAYGIRDPTRDLTPAGDLTLVRWQADRTLHPMRLHAALGQLADGVIRSSGRLDVADQPDSVVGWDSAGESLLLGPIAPCRRHPANRTSSLALLGDNLDAERIVGVLDSCLLTDYELSLVHSGWDEFADAFPGWPAQEPRSGGNAA